MNQEDHDLLTQIANDVKHLVKNFDKHIQEDKESFKSQGNDIKWNSKIIWMGLGALALIQFLVNIPKLGAH